MQLHCPKCGDVLAESTSGTLRCARGQMELSQELGERLLECYVLHARTPREKPFAFPVGGVWFCPACGVPTQERNPGDVRCTACSRSLAEFLHALVELHPHARFTDRNS
jgi:ribosomal protein S27E